MSPYLYTPLNESFSVHRVINARNYDLRGRKLMGESHPFPEIFCVIQEEETLIVDQNHYSVQQGELFIYPPNCYHGTPEPSLCHCVAGILAFDGETEALRPLYGKVIALTPLLFSRYRQLLEDAALLMTDSPRSQKSFGMLPREGVSSLDLQRFKNRLELFLLDLLDRENQQNSDLSPATRKKNEQMNRITSFLSRHLTESFTCQQMALSLNTSVSALRKLIYEQKHCGPIAYFLRMKIEEAQDLLLHSAMNINEIAEHLGFDSASHFSRHFKKIVGITPGSYRQSRSSLR